MPFFLVLLATALALIGLVAAQTTAANCYSLASSKYCGAAFGKYSVSMYIQVGNQRATSVSQFDQALDSYFGSAADKTAVDQLFGCTGWNGTVTPQYRITHTCYALLNEVASQQCNPSVAIPPLCQDTCTTYVTGWKSFVGNTQACPNQALTINIYQNLVASCDSAGNNGKASDQCISGETNEPDTCGFAPNDADAACAHCSTGSNDQSACCKNVFATHTCPNSNGHPVSDPFFPPSLGDSNGRRTLAIVLPVVLGTLFLLLLLAAILLIRRRRRTAQGHVKQLLPTASSRRLFSGKVGRSSPSKPTAVRSPRHLSVDPLRCRVVHPFTPRMQDEIALTPGDICLLFRTFDDGWAIGFNTNTNQEGTIPLVCVTAYDTSAAALTSGTAMGVSPAPTSKSVSDRSIDTFNPADIERSLMSLNASAAAIDATVRAAAASVVPPRPSIGGRSVSTVHDSQLPRRYSSKRPGIRRRSSAGSQPNSQLSNSPPTEPRLSTT
ncbi:hypothetical protein IWQ60_010423 [Tieghemiomyces parasiticus]|uniref:SH3 domain-containing protein n=1 Tax=Tieghemiomyces parasiticus TaxID=78921 RepID=A0A9W7ZUJ8_9FUNG|nr:hypothetical protein IWQ60_010423 [Tieghemiomyces parasiticus]